MEFYQFTHPATILIAGPSGCGKTSFVKQMLMDKQRLFNVRLDKIIWCYSLSGSAPEIPQVDVFMQGMPESFENHDKENILYVLDDMLLELDNELISNLFTKFSHHYNISVCVLSQNLFEKGQHMRTISLNSKYLVIFKSPRDSSQFNFLARQIMPNNSKELVRVFNEATRRPHSYLLLDLTQRTSELLRYRTEIFDKYHSGIVYCDLSLKDDKVKHETFASRPVFALYD